MKIHTIQYHKVFNLGNYQNEKIGVEITIEAGDDPVKCHMEAVEYVEKAHKFQKMMPDYRRAHEIVNDPMNYTGRNVEDAKKAIQTFEENFPEFIEAYNSKKGGLIASGDNDEYDENLSH